MSLFPEIQETGISRYLLHFSCVDAQTQEYNSLRRSIQESISIFSELKEELQSNSIPNEEQLTRHFTVDQSADDLMRKSSELCIFLSWCLL